jgi:hypothetical protein
VALLGGDLLLKGGGGVGQVSGLPGEVRRLVCHKARQGYAPAASHGLLRRSSRPGRHRAAPR